MAWIVADIGGTNARFALADNMPNSGDRLTAVEVLSTADYPDLSAAVQAYLARQGTVRVTAVCAAVAGPTEDDFVTLTNASWAFSVGQTRAELARLGIETVTLINDFHALALALPHIPEPELRRIGPQDDTPVMPLVPRCVIGAGTGLGVGTVIPRAGRWIALPGEGGHVACPALTPEEWAVIQVLQRTQEAVTAECFLCGDGLERLYTCLATVRGKGGLKLDAPTITQAALMGQDPLAVSVLDMFCSLLGTVSANAALTTGARGGLYLGGGILPRLGDFLYHSSFRKRFEMNVRMSAYLRAIPTWLILSETPALYGTLAWLDDWEKQRGKR